MTEQDRAEFEKWGLDYYRAERVEWNSGVPTFLTYQPLMSLNGPSYRRRRADEAMDAYLAARRTQSEQVRELVEAVDVLLNSGEKMHNPYYSDRVWQNLHDAHKAAQLKEVTQ